AGRVRPFVNIGKKNYSFYSYNSCSKKVKDFQNDFRAILSAATSKIQFVKFEINFEEFLRVAHPSKHGQ
ncbi:MAG: hypothetical protein IKJ81_01110, partial [Bacteroidales bacterium]|nr:hypothetical protein [Bacteroidales bacterium]